TEAAPVSLEHFPALEGALDLIYNPARTRLLMDAGARGLACAGGLLMLVGQAAAAWEVFTGCTMEAGKEQNVLQMLRRRMENIVLVGMPGCGKTTVGKLLAENLGKRLVDTDAEIVEAAGCSIPEIFQREGEAGFRALESEVIKKFGKESGLVLATGCGCVTREENYRHLHQNGSIVFIERPLGELAREGRPLSQGDLDAMYAKRQPLYRRFAECTVLNGGGIAALDTAQNVQLALNVLAQKELLREKLDETASD
ncbi:MAG: AAA family ATPase, partial [Treponema sp.]|nr:AAA family ATPase [Treponema sp.]